MKGKKRREITTLFTRISAASLSLIFVSLARRLLTFPLHVRRLIEGGAYSSKFGNLIRVGLPHIRKQQRQNKTTKGKHIKKGRVTPANPTDQEPILRRIIGNIVDFPSGHGRGGKGKKAEQKI